MKNNTHTNNQNSDHLITFTSILDMPVSIFDNVKSISPTTINLGSWIDWCTNTKNDVFEYHRQKVKLYQQTGNLEIKKSLPAICIGALITTRSKNIPDELKIVNITGLMQFDIDLKDNPNIGCAATLRDEVRNIAYVAFCSRSVSGNGVWGIVMINEKEKHKEHFEQLKKDFAFLGIQLDPSKGGNPTDLRIYSFDPDAYIADKFKIYGRKNYAQKKYDFKYSEKDESIISDKVNTIIKKIQNRNIDIAPDYQSYLRLGFALANQFKEEGRHFFHAICSCSLKYNEVEADRQYTSCLKAGKNGISIGTFFYLCKVARLH